MSGRAVVIFILAALLAAGIAAPLILIDVESWAAIRAGSALYKIHPILPLAFGAGLAAVAAALIRLLLLEAVEPVEAETSAIWIHAATTLAVATLCVVGAVAVARGLDPVIALLILVLGTATLIAAGQTYRSFQSGGSLRFDSNWGGLGGGQGGWRVSSSTAMALLFLVLLGTTVAIGGAALSDGNVAEPNPEAVEDKDTNEASENGADANKAVD